MNDNCKKDHKSISDDILVALRYIVKTRSCFRGSDCRIEDCSAGHLCQNHACKNGIPDDKCRFDCGLHHVNAKLDRWVPAFNPSLKSISEHATTNQKIAEIATEATSSATVDDRPSQLPKDARAGFIPVNAEGERLDIFMEPPTGLQSHKLTKFRAKNSLCAALFLRGGCTTSEHCPYSHNPAGVDDDVLYAFRYFLRVRGCAKKGACRIGDCTWGHVCSRPACAGGSQSRREGVC